MEGSGQTPDPGQHYVHPYTKDDGTQVPGHMRHNRGQKPKPGPGGGPRHAVSKKSAGAGIAVTLVLGGGAAVTIAHLPDGLHASLPEASGADAGSVSSHDAQREVRIELSRTQAALIAAGNRVKFNLRLESNCADHSYGPQVHPFFVANPCRWLVRASFTIDAGSHTAVLVAISWVDMRDGALARRYKRLVGKGGTGNITELTRDTGPYRNVRYNGLFYTSGMTGNAVWNLQVQPVGSLPTAAVNKILNESRPARGA